jgi:peptidoglycan/LPS O-acetylase OafA/YrhL
MAAITTVTADRGHDSPAVRSHVWMPPLDGLRGIAILMVLGLHFSGDLPFGGYWHPVQMLLRYGWAGVDLFFVLSGFLITGILLDSRESQSYFRSFYMRRVLRIFPVYYVSLIVVLLALPVWQASYRPPTSETLMFFGYLQSWYTGKFRFIVGHYWSLGVEEQFYFAWPLVIYYCSPRRALRIAIGGVALSVALRWIGLALHVDPEFINHNTFTRMDAVLIGAITAFLLRNTATRLTMRKFAGWLWCAPPIVIAVLWLARAGRIDPVTERFGFTLVALGFAALLVSAVLTMGERTPLQALLTCWPLRQVGKLSYSIYIWHIFIAELCIHPLEAALHWKGPSPVHFGLILAAAILAGGASYYIIEKPFLRMKARFSA